MFIHGETRPVDANWPRGEYTSPAELIDSLEVLVILEEKVP